MIFVKLTNGFGNNLFQYIAGRLLAEHHNSKLILIAPSNSYYGIADLKNIGLKYDAIQTQIDQSNFEIITDNNYNTAYNNDLKNTPLFLDGYFEDYKYFYDNIENIKTWFPIEKKRSNNDLVVQIRLGDRLFYKKNYDKEGKPIVGPEKFVQAINQFRFNKLYIVSDMPLWKKVKLDKFLKYKYHIAIDPQKSVDPKISLSYFNSLINILEKFDPIIQNRTVSNDFSFIRSFDNILFQHSTMAWWAAVLSKARKIGVYGPWRPNKKNLNKNLSKIPLQGWFQWQ